MDVALLVKILLDQKLEINLELQWSGVKCAKQKFIKLKGVIISLVHNAATSFAMSVKRNIILVIVV
jgi:hypothetical protein